MKLLYPFHVYMSRVGEIWEWSLVEHCRTLNNCNTKAIVSLRNMRTFGIGRRTAGWQLLMTGSTAYAHTTKVWEFIKLWVMASCQPLAS